jgi:hypothetical protein
MADAERWLDWRDGDLLIELLPRLSEHGAALAERRLIAPSQRRVTWKRRRWEAIMALAKSYDIPDGRAKARAIVRDITDPDSAEPRQRDLARIARQAGGALLKFGAIRNMLAGLGTYQHFGVPNPPCNGQVAGGANNDVGTRQPGGEEPQATHRR